MSGHTPGPWAVDGLEVYAGDDCDIHPIADCSCNHTCRDADEVRANASLIAAAPDLAAACQWIVGYHEGDGPMVTIEEYLAPLKAALAKAGIA